MPSFDEDAWKARPCNGQPPGTAPGYLFPAPATLTRDEIDAVVAYLQARVIGKGGTITKEECLAYIKEVWTDMRPLSLRKKMQEQEVS